MIVELKTSVDSIWHLVTELHKSEGEWAAGRWSFTVEVDGRELVVHAILPSFITPFQKTETVVMVHDTFLRAYQATVGL